MNRNTIRTWAFAAGVGLLAAACSESPTGQLDRQDAPPLFGAQQQANGIGACMGDDVLTYNAQVPPNEKASWSNTAIPNGNFCTANDIYLASAVATHVSFDGGNNFQQVTGPIQCAEGSTFIARVDALIAQNANSARSDIGIWIAQGPASQQQAVSGTCNHYNLIAGVDGSLNLDGGDVCGDMSSTTGPIGVPLGDLQVHCTPNENNKVQVHSCIGWTVPGGDRQCPFPSGQAGPQNFRWGTVPGNTSKCNCEPFELEIEVVKDAKIEVRKVVDPTNDNGQFNLFVQDAGNAVVASATNVGHGGTTGAGGTVVPAGTSQNPGASYTFGETAGAGTSLANYITTWACVHRAGGAHSAGSGSGAGPNPITLLPDQDVICTFTNVRKPRLRVVKQLVPDTDNGKFVFTIGGQNFNNGGAGYGHNQGTAFQDVTIGQAVAISEAALAGTNLSDYTSTLACVNQNNQAVNVSNNTGTSGSVVPTAGADITCTFTNTRKPKIELRKSLTGSGSFDLFIRQNNSGGAIVAQALGVGNNGTTGIQTVNIGNYHLSEAAANLSEYLVTGPVCEHRVGGANVQVNNGVVALAAGQDVVCTITNVELATIIINKVVQGAISAQELFDFSRQQIAPAVGGTSNFSAAAGLVNNSGKTLAPGTYRVCEVDPPVNYSVTGTLDNVGINLVYDGIANTYCHEFTLAAGQTRTIEFTNEAPGGDARTIGYWRNWSSCSNGNQFAKAIQRGTWDKTLDGNLGLLPNPALGSLGFAGAAQDQASASCTAAARILSKRDINNTNRASDPAYNMAAQLLAAMLNRAAGAYNGCNVGNANSYDDGTMIGDARKLLDDIGFTGSGASTMAKGGSATAQQIAKANQLAELLDLYNNNTCVTYVP